MQNVSKNGIWAFLDVEGPCTLNDNAFEALVALARMCGLGEEVGIRFYQRISAIDDNWGDFHKIAKDPTYSSGHTLKVILPFYKAMGADSQWLYNFARKTVRAVPNIDEVLTNLTRDHSVWQISTSYQWFIQAFCDLVGFDFIRACCTRVERFNEIPLSKEEARILQAFMKKVAQMPIIKYDGKTGEVTEKHQPYYDQITDFIWEFVYEEMLVGELLRVVHPIGQSQKREAMEEILQKSKVPLIKAIYIGDSQTDVQAVQLLKDVGLTMMFNGKGKVCRDSDIMYIGEDARAIREVTDLFAEQGRDTVIDYYTPLREAKCGGLLAAVTKENIEDLEKKSVEKRKQFRGVHIGELT